jgi:BspA type Leucine rich repeat region (6 copies)
VKSSIEAGEFGKRLIVREAWNDELEQFAAEQQIGEIDLATIQHGWLGNDVAFLRSSPWLKVLEIDHQTIHDISAISSLKGLIVLKLDTPRCKIVPDLSVLQKLRMFVLAYWIPGAEAAFNCLNLERLFLYKYPFSDLAPLSRLQKLDSLVIMNTFRLKSLNGIARLQNLQHLGIYLCPKLTDITQVAELKHVKDLAFETCKKARPFDVVGAVKGLRSLAFNNCGPIESIAALRNTPKLEELFFYESTNVLNGDLWPMAALPKLRCHAFRDRKHYSHNGEYFDVHAGAGHGHLDPRNRFGPFGDPNYEPLVPQKQP